MTLKEEINALRNNRRQANDKVLTRLFDILESIDARFDNIERVQALLNSEIKRLDRNGDIGAGL